MRPLSCDGARSRIAEMLDGALGPSEALRLEAHVASCAGCREAHADARLLADAFVSFARVARVAPPAEFAARVMSAIRAAQPARRAAAVPLGASIILVAIPVLATALLLQPPVARELARIVHDGTERSATSATLSVRVLAVVLAALAPLFERVADLASPIVSPLVTPIVTVMNALSVAALHVMTGPESVSFLIVIALLAGALLGYSRFPHERRGLHARIL
jgi:predicted anti-sigma-YlaC factor YlaD